MKVKQKIVLTRDDLRWSRGELEHGCSQIAWSFLCAKTNVSNQCSTVGEFVQDGFQMLKDKLNIVCYYLLFMIIDCRPIFRPFLTNIALDCPCL